jgi:hypothetical protein
MKHLTALLIIVAALAFSSCAHHDAPASQPSYQSSGYHK